MEQIATRIESGTGIPLLIVIAVALIALPVGAAIGARERRREGTGQTSAVVAAIAAFGFVLAIVAVVLVALSSDRATLWALAAIVLVPLIVSGIRALISPELGLPSHARTWGVVLAIVLAAPVIYLLVLGGMCFGSSGYVEF